MCYPENDEAVLFNYKPPKYIRMVGNAATLDYNTEPVVNGLLVKKDFKYQLMNEEWGLIEWLMISDITTFTQLKVCRILYRQHFKSRMDFNSITAICSMNAKSVDIVGFQFSPWFIESIKTRDYYWKEDQFNI